MEAHPLHHLGRLLHGTLSSWSPASPVFLFIGEDENRKLDERVRAFLTRGVTGDTDINIIDTAEFAIPGLDDEFRVIVSPWILSSLITDRLAAYYETVTNHISTTVLLSPVRLLRANNVCVIAVAPIWNTPFRLESNYGLPPAFRYEYQPSLL